MTQGTNAPPDLLDLLANLVNYPPALYPLTTFVARDAPAAFISNGVAWIPAAGGGISSGFGDGSNGNFTNNGPLTLGGPTYYQTFINGPLGVVRTNGFPIYAQVAIDNQGVIMDDGNDGVGLNAGTSTNKGYFNEGFAGGKGGNNGVGTAGSASGTYMNAPVGGNGGAGGAGGVNAGGAGATEATSPNQGSLHRQASALQGFDVGPVGAGAGGGGGGSDNPGGNGGGGGGGAGTVFLAAPTITNAGSITAKGGKGAAGAGAGNQGGGGGGGGGNVIQVAGTFLGAGTTDVLGGAGGAGVNAGVAGTAGTAGTAVKIPVV